MKLDGAVALVTGSSGGIGAACAHALSDRGANVILHGRDAHRLDALAAQIGAKALRIDLTEPLAADRLATEARDVFGRIDVIVHAAGIGWYGRAATMPAGPITELLQVNLEAPARLTSALLREMVERDRGHVAFLGSIAGWTGVANEALYAATKAAVITYAESIRMELAASKVGVSVVSPAVARTEFFERRGMPYQRRIPRPVEPARVAAAVIRGIEEDRAHQMLPRWLAIAPVVRAVCPPAFRSLNTRFGQ